jgi:hypothetical protein
MSMRQTMPTLPSSFTCWNPGRVKEKKLVT